MRMPSAPVCLGVPQHALGQAKRRPYLCSLALGPGQPTRRDLLLAAYRGVAEGEVSPAGHQSGELGTAMHPRGLEVHPRGLEVHSSGQSSVDGGVQAAAWVAATEGGPKPGDVSSPRNRLRRGSREGGTCSSGCSLRSAGDHGAGMGRRSLLGGP